MTTDAPATTEGTPAHLEFPAVAAAVPPGTNPIPAKPAKAVSKLYFIEREGELLAGEGFRTKEEVAKYVKRLEPAEYTLVAKFTKKIVVSDVRRVKGV